MRPLLFWKVLNSQPWTNRASTITIYTEWSIICRKLYHFIDFIVKTHITWTSLTISKHQCLLNNHFGIFSGLQDFTITMETKPDQHAHQWWQMLSLINEKKPYSQEERFSLQKFLISLEHLFLLFKDRLNDLYLNNSLLWDQNRKFTCC